MNKSIVLIVAFLAHSFSILGCDVCGGGSSGIWNGWIPQFGKSQFQWRSEFRNQNNIMLNGLSTDQNFIQSDFNFKYFANEKWMLQMTIPFKSTVVDYSHSNLKWIGLGDVRIGASRVLWKSSNNAKWNALLLSGIQWQLPTGKFMLRDNMKMMLPFYLQNGSGAHSVIGQYYFLISKAKWGFWSSGGYQKFAKNELHTQWGDRWLSQLGAFSHSEKFNMLNRVGQFWGLVSFQYDNSAALKEFEVSQNQTQAAAWTVQGQTDVYWNQYVLTFSGTHLISTTSDSNYPMSKWKWAVGITKVF
jgi:hypothetical protein